MNVSGVQAILKLWLLTERFLADAVLNALTSASAATSAVKVTFSDKRINLTFLLDTFSVEFDQNGAASRMGGVRIAFAHTELRRWAAWLLLGADIPPFVKLVVAAKPRRWCRRGRRPSP